MQPNIIMYKVLLLLLSIIFPLYLVSSYDLRIFYIVSNSMYPVIMKDSIIVTKTSKNYIVGDIVSFSSSALVDSIITHRIVQKRSNDIFVTKGDNNSYIDINVVNRSNIIGKVVFALPPIGLSFIYVTLVFLYSFLGYFLGKILYTIIQTFHAIIKL